MEFSGKVALITGAAKGIGFATAKAFAAAGARIMLVDQDPAVEQAASRIQSDSEAAFFVADVSDPQSCKNSVAAVQKRFGRLDYAFNNAGVGGQPLPVDEVDDVDWQRVININLSGVFYCTKYQVPAMRKIGGGVIVNNASVLGVRALPDTSVQYTAAKHGVIGFTRQVAVNHGAEGIRCVAVCPGLIETGLIDPNSGGGVAAGGIPDKLRDWFMQRTPQNRVGEPIDIANTVLSLCSDRSAFVNGTYIVVDGGLTQG